MQKSPSPFFLNAKFSLLIYYPNLLSSYINTSNAIIFQTAFHINSITQVSFFFQFFFLIFVKGEGLRGQSSLSLDLPGPRNTIRIFKSEIGYYFRERDKSYNITPRSYLIKAITSCCAENKSN